MTDASDLDETAEDIKVLRATAQEYDDSAEACDTPGLARFRAARRLRAAELRAIAERFAQLVALATGGAETAKLPWGCSRCGSELFTGEQKSGICGDCAVTRFEVIDHRKDGNGRIFAAWDASVELSYQDGGRTLKVFVVDGVATPEPRAR